MAAGSTELVFDVFESGSTLAEELARLSLYAKGTRMECFEHEIEWLLAGLLAGLLAC